MNAINGCTTEGLHALVRGETNAEATAHVAACAECARELAWLRTERGLFRAEKVQLPSHVWQGIERRIILEREAQRQRRLRWVRGTVVVSAFAAAATLLFYVWGNGAPPPANVRAILPSIESPAPGRVLSAAEREYSAAIETLQEQYQSERGQLAPDVAERYDSEFRKLRDVLTSERSAARNDLRARRRVLRAYSAYMRSMQAVVLEVRK